jgi:cysteine desulfurase
MIKKINPHLILHVDGVQGFGKESADLKNVDLYSFSAHKFHGPGGVGGLMARRGIKLTPLMYGGRQQSALRPGTENITGIVQMAATASAMFRDMDINYNHAASIKAILASVTNELPDVYINESSPDTLPYILNMSFLGVKGEVLVHTLSEEGIYVSMGAACRNKKPDVSPLVLMGFVPARAESAIRFSFSPLNTREEAEIVKDALIKHVKALRKVQHKKR